MKILLLDIETAPNVVHVWGFFNQNVAVNQVVKPGYTLCWAAKFVGENTMHFSSVHEVGNRRMLLRMRGLMSKADVICHFNGASFDVPTLNKEFLKAGMRPPSPFKQMDLLLTMRKRFRFPSNKLEYICRELGIGAKVKHYGHELWTNCMAGDDAAWKTMREYNMHDVVLLEKLYEVLRPWIVNHPNMSSGDNPSCPRCGGKRAQKRGLAVNRTGKFKRYQCSDCGGWFASVKPVERVKKNFKILN